MFERGERLLDIGPLGYSNADQRVPFIRRDFDTGDDYGADAGIGKFVADEFGEFFADCFGNPLSTMWHVRLFNPLHARPYQNAAQEPRGFALHALQHLFGVRVVAGNGDGGNQ